MPIKSAVLRIALFAATMAPVAAFAGTLSSAYPLQVYQEVTPGFIVPGSYAVSNAPGMISVAYCFDAVACVNGSSDVELGDYQLLEHATSATGTPADYAGGGSSGSFLNYYVELVDPGHVAPETVNFSGQDMLIANGVGDASYLVRIDAGNLSNGLAIQDCTFAAGCYQGIPRGSLASISTIMLTPNTVYGLHAEVDTYNGSLTDNGAFALIEALRLTVPIGSTATLDFSPGLSGSAPEPASWALMLTGLGLAGGMARRRRTLAL